MRALRALLSLIRRRMAILTTSSAAFPTRRITSERRGVVWVKCVNKGTASLSANF